MTRRLFGAVHCGPLRGRSRRRSASAGVNGSRRQFYSRAGARYRPRVFDVCRRRVYNFGTGDSRDGTRRAAGGLKWGKRWEIVGIRETQKTTVTGVEMFRKLLDEGVAGDNVGCLLRGIKREEIERGQVLAKPGSITPHTKYEAEVYVLTKDEGGRHTPFFNGYRPQFYFRTTDVTGSVTLQEGTEMVMPGGQHADDGGVTDADCDG